MTRETSLEAYTQMVESGKLRGKQAEALAAIMKHGPATSAEIIQRLGTNVNLWRARFTELAARGLITEVGSRKCTVTGRTALVWLWSGRTKPLKAKHRLGTAALRKIANEAVQLLLEHHEDTPTRPVYTRAVELHRQLSGR